MWKNSCLVQNAEAKELCNCRLVEPLFPPVLVPGFPKVLICQWLLLSSHGQLTLKAPSHSDAAATTATTTTAATTSHSVSCSKDVTCREAFTFLFSSCLRCCTSFFWCFCHAAVFQKRFQAPKLRALTTSPRGFELAMEKKIIERAPVPLCFRRKEFASWQCASSLARWGTCWDYMTSGGVDWA